MKTCTKCGETKALSEFYPRDGASDGFRRECKVCWAGQSRAAYYRRDPATRSALTRQWRGDPDPTKKSATYARHQKRHAAKFAARNAQRYASKIRATPSWANAFFISEIYDLAALRTKHTGVRWEVDHIVPLKSPLVCGMHVEHNLRVIPKAVNIVKGNRHWPDMPDQRVST